MKKLGQMVKRLDHTKLPVGAVGVKADVVGIEVCSLRGLEAEVLLRRGSHESACDSQLPQPTVQDIPSFRNWLRHAVT